MAGMDPEVDAVLEAILDEVEDWHGTPHPEQAAHFEEHARALPPGAMGRAAWFVYAGEAWELEGDPGHAKAMYEEAVTDGGPSLLDPRAELLNVLLELGETDRAEEVLDELTVDLRDGRVTETFHVTVGEALELHGRLQEALRWFDAGVTWSESFVGDPDLVCLNGHFRVRRALGLPPDRYDELVERRRQEYLDDLGDDDSLLASTGGGAAGLMTVLYWPAEQFPKVLERYPALLEECGADHAEHRQHVELHLRDLAVGTSAVAVSVGSLDGLVGFAEQQADHAVAASTRAAYAAQCGRLGQTVTWPPGRNEPCWCGSGRKYKRCCGAFRDAG